MGCAVGRNPTLMPINNPPFSLSFIYKRAWPNERQSAIVSRLQVLFLDSEWVSNWKMMEVEMDPWYSVLEAFCRTTAGILSQWAARVCGEMGEGDLSQGCHHFCASTVADTNSFVFSVSCFVNFKVFLDDVSTKNMFQNISRGCVVKLGSEPSGYA